MKNFLKILLQINLLNNNQVQNKLKKNKKK